MNNRDGLLGPVAVANQYIYHHGWAHREGIAERSRAARIGRVGGAAADSKLRIGNPDAVLPSLRPAEVHGVFVGARPVGAGVIAIDAGDALTRAEPVVALCEPSPRPVRLRVQSHNLGADCIEPVLGD